MKTNYPMSKHIWAVNGGGCHHQRTQLEHPNAWEEECRLREGCHQRRRVSKGAS
jgi:hypothetical protein